MSRHYLSCLGLSVLAPIMSFALIPAAANAQFYSPLPPQTSSTNYSGGIGVDHGLRNNGFNPSIGLGYSQLGAGVGAGLGPRGIGYGVNSGLGPIGLSTDGGVSLRGIGARGGAGFGNTGAAFEGGLNGGGLGGGANARVLGFGGGASVGMGNKGPGLGANVAFGPIGTLLIGSHRNSYPGAQQTASHMHPSRSASYYAAQDYGNRPYYQPASKQQRQAVPVQSQAQEQYYNRCAGEWTC